MTPLFTRVGLLLLLGLAACSADSSTPAGKAATSADARFEQYKRGFIDSLWYYNPEWASSQGYHRYDSVLLIPNADRRRVEAAAVARRRRELAGFAAQELSAQNLTDYRLLENHLAAARFYADTLREWEWNPAAYNLGAAVGEILNGRYQPLDRRLRAISQKINRSADFYEAAKDNLSRPTREHTILAMVQNEGGLASFGPGLLDSVNRSGLSAAEKQELRQRISTTRQVIENYLDFLRREVLAAGNFRSFRLGKPLFTRKFALEIQSRYSAAEAYRQAQVHKQELLQDMRRRTARLWPRYFSGQPFPADSLQAVQQMISRLARQHATPAGFVGAVRAQIPELVRWVDEHQLLTQDPAKPLVVRETPLYMRGSGAGASVSAPGPYDKAAATYYNVDPLDGMPAAQAESFLREYNRYTLQILNIHEAIPGHYTQLVYANRSPSLVKAIFGNGAMVEGWAVYTERMMLESGYGGNSDELWLLWDKWNLRVTLNALLDHEVHVNNIPEAAAVAMLRQTGFQEEAEARNKWRRATLSQVQLSSYFVGSTEIWDLRREVAARQGRAFQLRDFHEQFLSYGSAPVPYIRQLMLQQSKTPDAQQ